MLGFGILVALTVIIVGCAEIKNLALRGVRHWRPSFPYRLDSIRILVDNSQPWQLRHCFLLEHPRNRLFLEWTEENFRLHLFQSISFGGRCHHLMCYIKSNQKAGSQYHRYRRSYCVFQTAQRYERNERFDRRLGTPAEEAAHGGFGSCGKRCLVIFYYFLYILFRALLFNAELC